MGWKQLEPDKATAFIKSVASAEEPVVFDLSLCEVHSMPMPFYDGYSLYRIVNKHMLPRLLLDYFSNGENHYYLNGSEQAFINLNAREAISLDEKNVWAYVDMYITYVYEHGNSLQFVSDPYSMPQKGAQAMEMHFGAIRHAQNSGVTYNAESGRFQITAPLIYQGKTTPGYIEVNKRGAIYIQKPVEVSFLTQLTPGPIPYRHPEEDKIIEQTVALLDAVPTGRELLEYARETDVPIRVWGSPNYHGFITNSGMIYMLMPAAEMTAKYTQVLVLAGALRDSMQISVGFIHPHPSKPEGFYAAVNYPKNLDIIMEMCKIVMEYEKNSTPEALQALDSMGFGNVYAAYKTGIRPEALMKVYIETLRRYGFLEKE
jgi:hypothetical protein